MTRRAKRSPTPFQSTPSVGRATIRGCINKNGLDISIHALRGEGDASSRSKFLLHPYFNPRPPWGGRLKVPIKTWALLNFNPRPPWGGRRVCPWTARTMPKFQSTPSVGRATPISLKEANKFVISIHALRGEGDQRTGVQRESILHFNPRPPWGGRLNPLVRAVKALVFQSTPSVGRATMLWI